MKKKISALVLAFLVILSSPATFFASKTEAAAPIPTIAETFPDSNLAQGVARELNVEVTAELSQTMIDGLTHLDISHAGISDVTGIEKLTALTVLTLDSNKITSLPDSLGNLDKLKNLSIEDNQLTSLPDSIENLSALEELYLIYNQLTSLPDNIGKLSALKVLAIEDNYLTSLPGSIGNLDELQYLFVDNNQLTSLPDSIGDISALEELSLWVNNLTYLPESIGNLSALTYLDVEENRLTNLPKSMVKLTSLDTLYLGWNMFPEDYKAQLIAAGMNGDVIIDATGSGQYRLALKPDLGSFTITHGRDLDNMKLESLLELPVLPHDDFMAFQSSTQINGHNLILDNYVDENQEPVSLEDYLKNGVVQKNGTVFAQVRDTTPGIFSDENINAITENTVQLNFQTTNYELSFDLNGITGTVPETQSLLEGEVGTKVTLEYEKEEGLSFAGWNRKQDGSGEFWEPGTTPMVGENVTLYAIWTKMGPPPYITVIHFDANGGIGTMEDQQCASGNVGKLAKNTFTREGYTFAGWSITINGEVAYLDEAMDPFTAKENITLYAQWKANNQEVAPSNALPATGGYSLILIGMLLIGIGSVIVFKRVVKNKA